MVVTVVVKVRVDRSIRDWSTKFKPNWPRVLSELNFFSFPTQTEFPRTTLQNFAELHF